MLWRMWDHEVRLVHTGPEALRIVEQYQPDVVRFALLVLRPRNFFMTSHFSPPPQHPVVSRRAALQAGSIGLLGLGMNHLVPLRALSASAPRVKARSVLYIFLSGGLTQLDSFDLKPDAPAEIRGEFQAIATRTPGIQICEHLPRLAQRSHLWALCRSLTHPYTGHSEGHLAMLTGRTSLPAGFDAS